MSGLILETSTEKGLLVLSIEGAPIAAKPLVGGPELSKTLALEVKNFLTFRPDYIAVGTGPGSYTGLRVGAALAKSLAFGWGIPLFGFCSLKAFEIPNATVLIDARMGGFYALLNETPALISLEEAAKITFFSSPHPELIRKRLSIPGTETSPDPQLLSRLAHDQFLKGNPTPISLSYLTNP